MNNHYHILQQCHDLLFCNLGVDQQLLAVNILNIVSDNSGKTNGATGEVLTLKGIYLNPANLFLALNTTRTNVHTNCIHKRIQCDAVHFPTMVQRKYQVIHENTSPLVPKLMHVPTPHKTQILFQSNLKLKKIANRKLVCHTAVVWLC
jgi:hypothetical protein